MLVSQTSFRGETSGGVSKCQLFSQTSFIEALKHSEETTLTTPITDEKYIKVFVQVHLMSKTKGLDEFSDKSYSHILVLS